MTEKLPSEKLRLPVRRFYFLSSSPFPKFCKSACRSLRFVKFPPVFSLHWDLFSIRLLNVRQIHEEGQNHVQQSEAGLQVSIPFAMPRHSPYSENTPFHELAQL